jgi:hypothetical protein
VRELIAKRIIEAAKTGELDPIRLYSQAILGFSVDDVSMPSVSVDRNPPDSGLCIDRVHSVIIESPAGTPVSAGLSSFFSCDIAASACDRSCERSSGSTRSWVMPMEEFIHQQNLERYRKMLSEKTARTAAPNNRLADEENRDDPVSKIDS